jgi:pimeloyl-ACP methyl ester carboxylesterase
MKELGNREDVSWGTAKGSVRNTAAAGFAQGAAPFAATFSRRRLLAQLGAFTAALAAVPALAAKPPLPQCEKGAQQSMALAEYEKALDTLPSEADCPKLKELHDLYNSRPRHTSLVPATRKGQTVNMAVVRTGKLGAGRVTVLVHGVLADHRTWWYVAGALGGDQELWILELPGCGQSTGHPADLEPDAFTPTAMAERIGLVLEQCLADRAALGEPVQHLTLAGHSLGGACVLRLLSSGGLRDRFPEMRRRLDALVLFAPCDVAVNCLPPHFQPLLKLTPAKVAIGDVLGVVGDKLKAQTRKSFFLPECATREQAERLSGGLTVAAHLRSAQAMVRGAVPWKVKENRPDWPAITALENDYAKVNVPCLIAWGEWDETLSETMGHKIRDHVPLGRLVEITGAGHSVISEQPRACVQILRTAQAEVEAGSFAALPLVCRYGKRPFDGDQMLARQG